MGLQQELGFRYSGPNALQRSLQQLASTKSGSRAFQRTLYHVDRPLHRWTGGRVTLPTVVIGLPVVMLTTTGARTGLMRTMPVAAIPFEDDLAVLGTNFGQPRTPGWVANLSKEPRATVAWRGRSVEVAAMPVPQTDVERLWRTAGRVYLGFPKYRERIGGRRDIRAFVLRPVG